MAYKKSCLMFTFESFVGWMEKFGWIKHFLHTFQVSSSCLKNLYLAKKQNAVQKCLATHGKWWKLWNYIEYLSDIWVDVLITLDFSKMNFSNSKNHNIKFLNTSVCILEPCQQKFFYAFTYTLNGKALSFVQYCFCILTALNHCEYSLQLWQLLWQRKLTDIACLYFDYT